MIKTCSKCKKEYPATLEFFHKQKSGKYGFRGTCKPCKLHIRREYRNSLSGKEKIRQYNSNPIVKAKSKVWHYIWRHANPEKIKEYGKNRQLNLTDDYIASILHSKVKSIPAEIIETKRIIIQLKRELKNYIKII